MLRLLGLLGLDLTDADCSNAFAGVHQRCLDDSLTPALTPLLPTWHASGFPDQAQSASSSAIAPALLPAHGYGTDVAWVLPRPAFAHTAEASSAHAQGQAAGADQPGGAAGGGAHLPPPWHLASEERRLFLLRQLALGPFKDSCFFAEALLDVIAASSTSTPGAQSIPMFPSLLHPTRSPSYIKSQGSDDICQYAVLCWALFRCQLGCIIAIDARDTLIKGSRDAVQSLVSKLSSAWRRCAPCWQSAGSTCPCGMPTASICTRLASQRWLPCSQKLYMPHIPAAKLMYCRPAIPALSWQDHVL